MTSTSLTFSLKRGALGDGEQADLAVLALVAGESQEVLLGQPRRLAQHRLGDLDGVVLGKLADGDGRRVLDRRQLGGELGARANFDAVGEARNDAVEQIDLRVGIALGADQEQIGDVPEDFQLLAGRAGGKAALEIFNNRSLDHAEKGSVDLIRER